MAVLSRLAKKFSFIRRSAPSKLDSPFFEHYQCRSRGLSNSILISHEFNYAYTQIFKSASSTVTVTLCSAGTGDETFKDRSLKGLKKKYFSRPNELNEEQFHRFRTDYFKFTFVRNLYSRFLSAYLFKFDSPKKNPDMNNRLNQRWKRRRDHITSQLGKPSGAEISLTDFLNYLEFEGSIDLDAHWTRQSDLIAMPTDEYDMIGKVENLDNDLSVVLSRIFNTDKQVVCRHSHATSASSKLDLLSADQRCRIHRLYEADFDNFHYSRHS